MRKPTAYIAPPLAVSFLLALIFFGSGEQAALVAYIWGLVIGFFIYGPAFERLLAQIARIKTDPTARVMFRTRRKTPLTPKGLNS